MQDCNKQSLAISADWSLIPCCLPRARASPSKSNGCWTLPASHLSALPTGDCLSNKELMALLLATSHDPQIAKQGLPIWSAATQNLGSFECIVTYAAEGLEAWGVKLKLWSAENRAIRRSSGWWHGKSHCCPAALSGFCWQKEGHYNVCQLPRRLCHSRQAFFAFAFLLYSPLSIHRGLLSEPWCCKSPLESFTCLFLCLGKAPTPWQRLCQMQAQCQWFVLDMLPSAEHCNCLNRNGSFWHNATCQSKCQHCVCRIGSFHGCLPPSFRSQGMSLPA